MHTGSEHTYYRQGNVAVTSARVVIGGKTYALSNVSSVSMHVVPASLLWPIVLVALGLILTLSSALVPSSWLPLIVSGFAIFVLGVVAHIRAQPSYVLRLGSASGEIAVFSSRSRDAVEPVVAAINEAIVKRAGP